MKRFSCSDRALLLLPFITMRLSFVPISHNNQVDPCSTLSIYAWSCHRLAMIDKDDEDRNYDSALYFVTSVRPASPADYPLFQLGAVQ
jgi:hypothetical protein